MSYEQMLKKEARDFGYSSIQELARIRVQLKRDLRSLNVTFNNTDSTPTLQWLLEQATQ